MYKSKNVSALHHDEEVTMHIEAASFIGHKYGVNIVEISDPYRYDYNRLEFIAIENKEGHQYFVNIQNAMFRYSIELEENQVSMLTIVRMWKQWNRGILNLSKFEQILLEDLQDDDDY